jgi:integrator complex subunit 11
MKKVRTVNLHEMCQVDDELQIKAYYAGHVLGAAMFEVRVGQQSVVYTGDYNMTPDRHLGAAWIDKCRPDILITESTYATTIRDSKRCRERDFIKKVHTCLDKGGKVLIPVFALGRAQELCILLETYWERMQLQYPIYFSLGLTEKANNYYQLFITWTSQKIKKTFVERNMFEFKHIKPFDRSYIDKPGPMVVFATPGMLHAGLSLQIFKKWAPFEQNMIIIPGYCVAGTVGHKILNGQRKIELENKQILDVKLSVEYMSFSAHADSKGIMQLIKNCEPKNVVLVHGENQKMDFLRTQIVKEFNIECYKPANGETIIVKTQPLIPASISLELLKNDRTNLDSFLVGEKTSKKQKLMHGVLLLEQNCIKVLHPKEAIYQLGLSQSQIKFSSVIKLKSNNLNKCLINTLHDLIQKELDDFDLILLNETCLMIDNIKVELRKKDNDLEGNENYGIFINWNLEDEELGSYVYSLIKENLSII